MKDPERIRLDTRADAIRDLRTDIAEIDSHIALLTKRGCGKGVMNATVKLRNDWLAQVEYMENLQGFQEEMWKLGQGKVKIG